MYYACFEAKEEPHRDYDIVYFVYENREGYFIEARIPGKSSEKAACQTAFLGKCSAELAESVTVCFAKGALRPIHLGDALCDIVL